jgi:hypothetical protein
MPEQSLRFRPFLVLLLHPEDVGKPVQVVLEVFRPHPGEPVEVPFHPGREAVDHEHRPQRRLVPDRGLVDLVRRSEGLNELPVGHQAVVHDGRSGLDVAFQGPQHLRRCRASVADFEYHQALVGVDGDADADLPPGDSPPHLPEMLAWGTVVERVDLVDPYPAREPRPPLPFGDRRKGLPPPEKRRVVVDSDDRGHHVQRDVERHHLKRPGVVHQVLLRPRQHRLAQELERPSAVGAYVPPLARPGLSPRPAGKGAAFRTDRPPAEGLSHLGEVRLAQPFPAFAGPDLVPQIVERVSVHPEHQIMEPRLFLSGHQKILPRLWETASGRSLSPNKPILAASQILRFVWHHHYTACSAHR